MVLLCVVRGVLEDSPHHLKHHPCSDASCHTERCREIEKTCSQSCVDHDDHCSQGRHARRPPRLRLQVSVGVHAGALQEPRSLSGVDAPGAGPVLSVIVNGH